MVGQSRMVCTEIAPASAFSETASDLHFKEKMHAQFRKTTMCKFEILGMCRKGKECGFAHSATELNSRPDLSRTKLCPALTMNGQCTDAGCRFAHSLNDRRNTFTAPVKTSTQVADCGESVTESTTDSVETLEHQLFKDKVHAQFRKTVMCKFYQMGTCSKGSQCAFAHEEEELQNRPDLSRTKLCERLVATGTCTDRNCPYAHGGDQLRTTISFHHTKQCRFWLMGDCKHGSGCRFSHEGIPTSVQVSKDINASPQEPKGQHNDDSSGQAKKPHVVKPQVVPARVPQEASFAPQANSRVAAKVDLPKNGYASGPRVVLPPRAQYETHPSDLPQKVVLGGLQSFLRAPPGLDLPAVDSSGFSQPSQAVSSQEAYIDADMAMAHLMMKSGEGDEDPKDVLSDLKSLLNFFDSDELVGA